MEYAIKEDGAGHVTQFAVPWSRADFVAKAEEADLSLTEEQIDDAMHSCFNNFDANFGINWEVIESALLEV